MENTIDYLPTVRILKEFADFSDNFSGRWFGFHNMFYEPYDGEIKQRLDLSDENDNGEPLNCFHISDYISHKRILEEGEYAHCFIDDFLDFKKDI